MAALVVLFFIVLFVSAGVYAAGHTKTRVSNEATDTAGTVMGWCYVIFIVAMIVAGMSA